MFRILSTFTQVIYYPCKYRYIVRGGNSKHEYKICQWFFDYGWYENTSLQFFLENVWNFVQSCFSQSHKVGNVGKIAISKCEIRNQGVHEDYISRLHALNSWFCMAELKWSWQSWHSCIASSLWKTLMCLFNVWFSQFFWDLELISSQHIANTFQCGKDAQKQFYSPSICVYSGKLNKWSFLK